MLVYSINSTQSFEMVQVIRDKILNHLVSISVTTCILNVNPDYFRARNGFLLSSLETRVTYVLISVKLLLRRAKPWLRSSIVPTRKQAQGITRMSPKLLSL
jgi:hypothetical protein